MSDKPSTNLEFSERERERERKKFFVYKYVFKNEEQYVGKTTNLERRISQHRRDNLKDIADECEIYYIECQNASEMDILETFFISLYKTYNKKNRAKNWKGVTSLIDEHGFTWLKYKTRRQIEEEKLLKQEKSIKTLTKENNRLSIELLEIKNKIKEQKDKINYESSILHNITNQKIDLPIIFCKFSFGYDDIIFLYKLGIRNVRFINIIRDYEGKIISKTELFISDNDVEYFVYRSNGEVALHGSCLDENNCPILNLSFGTYYCEIDKYHYILKNIIENKIYAVDINCFYSVDFLFNHENELCDNHRIEYIEANSKTIKERISINTFDNHIRRLITSLEGYEYDYYDNLHTGDDLEKVCTKEDIPENVFLNIKDILVVADNENLKLEQKINKFLKKFNLNNELFEHRRKCFK